MKALKSAARKPMKVKKCIILYKQLNISGELHFAQSNWAAVNIAQDWEASKANIVLAVM